MKRSNSSAAALTRSRPTDMRYRSILASAALALLLTQAVPAAAGDQVDGQFYTTVGPWKITKRLRPGNLWECSGIMNDGVDVLEVDHTPFADRLRVAFSAWEASNLAVGDIIPVSTRFSNAQDGPFEHVETAAKVSRVSGPRWSEFAASTPASGLVMATSATFGPVLLVMTVPSWFSRR